jgi:hypothetical protein
MGQMKVENYGMLPAAEVWVSESQSGAAAFSLPRKLSGTALQVSLLQKGQVLKLQDLI